MTFIAVTQRNSFNNRIYAWLYRGEFEEIRDTLPADARDFFTITANNYQDARAKARKMFDASVCVGNGLINQ